MMFVMNWNVIFFCHGNRTTWSLFNQPWIHFHFARKYLLPNVIKQKSWVYSVQWLRCKRDQPKYTHSSLHVTKRTQIINSRRLSLPFFACSFLSVCCCSFVRFLCTYLFVKRTSVTQVIEISERINWSNIQCKIQSECIFFGSFGQLLYAFARRDKCDAKMRVSIFITKVAHNPSTTQLYAIQKIPWCKRMTESNGVSGRQRAHRHVYVYKT